MRCIECIWKFRVWAVGIFFFWKISELCKKKSRFHNMTKYILLQWQYVCWCKNDNICRCRCTLLKPHLTKEWKEKWHKKLYWYLTLDSIHTSQQHEAYLILRQHHHTNRFCCCYLFVLFYFQCYSTLKSNNKDVLLTFFSSFLHVL